LKSDWEVDGIVSTRGITSAELAALLSPEAETLWMCPSRWSSAVTGSKDSSW
jgi:hypothetical protein